MIKAVVDLQTLSAVIQTNSQRFIDVSIKSYQVILEISGTFLNQKDLPAAYWISSTPAH